ncbi:type II secretion system minor pseudopilin GspK [Vibrio agarivorans]|uniref:Type II secretion system protein K n=1 Tax=Vibrio agarivorans TaxID=153622 RepID=A0ABT7XW08_9VIBR|nr:type II secretion system minor pseudopilin GspK [Vibrio agarivorans]MDN2479948.1 type II secretion system minor pseudopilin GspK [Vibrio agarivorans]
MAKSRKASFARKQRGVAIIVVLMILAVMASIAASMSGRLFTQFKRATNQINYQQAYWYSLGVEALAVVGIEQSYKDSDTINTSQAWALEEQTYPLDYGVARGRIWDRQACLNLNAIGSATIPTNSNQRPYIMRVWQYLLEAVDVDNYLAETITDSTYEFIDPDNSTQTISGVEDSYYESVQPAYLTANSWIADSSELRAINGVTGEIMQKVAPMVCALPTDQWVLNVNTIEPHQAPLLEAMFHPHLSDSDAKNLIEGRPYDGWDSVDDFLAESEMSSVEAGVRDEAKAFLGVDSQYFELDAQVWVEQSRVRIRSLLYSDNRETASVVRRRFGGISERVSDRSTN